MRKYYQALRSSEIVSGVQTKQKTRHLSFWMKYSCKCPQVFFGLFQLVDRAGSTNIFQMHREFVTCFEDASRIPEVHSDAVECIETFWSSSRLWKSKFNGVTYHLTQTWLILLSRSANIRCEWARIVRVVFSWCVKTGNGNVHSKISPIISIIFRAT